MTAAIDPFLDKTFVGRFNRRRHEDDSVNTCVDEPAIFERVRALAPQSIVELGCGTGGLTSVLAAHSPQVLSVDQSPAMVEHAKSEINATNVQFVCSRFEEFVPPTKPDAVVSGMAMHLVADLSSLCRLVYGWLQPGGTFIFSQRHPIRTANARGDELSRFKPSWTVSEYFEVGERTYQWLGYDVAYYHRTVSDIVTGVIDAGFRLDEMAEPMPFDHHHTDRGAENCSSPSVLLIRCSKPYQADGGR